LLPNHHNWSWYIQWMILDSLEGDLRAWCDGAGWFVCSTGRWNIQQPAIDLTFWPLSMQPIDKRHKPLLPNHQNYFWYIQWMI
jgi:hypothetical protein